MSASLLLKNTNSSTHQDPQILTASGLASTNDALITRDLLSLENGVEHIVNVLGLNPDGSGSTSDITSGNVSRDGIHIGPDGDTPSTGKGIVIKTTPDDPDQTGELWLNGEKVTTAPNITTVSTNVSDLFWDVKNNNNVKQLKASGPVSIGNDNILLTSDLTTDYVTTSELNARLDSEYYTKEKVNDLIANIDGTPDVENISVKVSELNWDTSTLAGKTIDQTAGVIKIGPNNAGTIKIGPNGNTPSGKGVVITTSASDGTGSIHINGKQFTPSNYPLKASTYSKTEIDTLLSGTTGGAGGDGGAGGGGGSTGSSTISAKVSALVWDLGTGKDQLKAFGPVTINGQNIQTETEGSNYYTTTQFDDKLEEKLNDSSTSFSKALKLSEMQWDLTQDGTPQLKTSGPVAIGDNNILTSEKLAEYTPTAELNDVISAKVSTLNWDLDGGNQLKATKPVTLAGENIATETFLNNNTSSLATKEAVNQIQDKLSTIEWDLGTNGSALKSDGKVTIGDAQSGLLYIGNTIRSENKTATLNVGQNATKGTIDVGIGTGSNKGHGSLVVGASTTANATGKLNIAVSDDVSKTVGALNVGTASSPDVQGGITLKSEGGVITARIGPNAETAGGKGVAITTDSDGTGHLWLNGVEVAVSDAPSGNLANDTIEWTSSKLEGYDSGTTQMIKVGDGSEGTLSVNDGIVISTNAQSAGSVSIDNTVMTASEDNKLILKSKDGNISGFSVGEGEGDANSVITRRMVYVSFLGNVYYTFTVEKDTNTVVKIDETTLHESSYITSNAFKINDNTFVVGMSDSKLYYINITTNEISSVSSTHLITKIVKLDERLAFVTTDNTNVGALNIGNQLGQIQWRDIGVTLSNTLPFDSNHVIFTVSSSTPDLSTLHIVTIERYVGTITHSATDVSIRPQSIYHMKDNYYLIAYYPSDYCIMVIDDITQKRVTLKSRVASDPIYDVVTVRDDYVAVSILNNIVIGVVNYNTGVITFKNKIFSPKKSTFKLAQADNSGIIVCILTSDIDDPTSNEINYLRVENFETGELTLSNSMTVNSTVTTDTNLYASTLPYYIEEQVTLPSNNSFLLACSKEANTSVLNSKLKTDISLRANESSFNIGVKKPYQSNIVDRQDYIVATNDWCVMATITNLENGTITTTQEQNTNDTGTKLTSMVQSSANNFICGFWDGTLRNFNDKLVSSPSSTELSRIQAILQLANGYILIGGSNHKVQTCKGITPCGTPTQLVNAEGEINHLYHIDQNTYLAVSSTRIIIFEVTDVSASTIRVIQAHDKTTEYNTIKYCHRIDNKHYLIINGDRSTAQPVYSRIMTISNISTGEIQTFTPIETFGGIVGVDVTCVAIDSTHVLVNGTLFLRIIRIDSLEYGTLAALGTPQQPITTVISMLNGTSLCRIDDYNYIVGYYNGSAPKKIKIITITDLEAGTIEGKASSDIPGDNGYPIFILPYYIFKDVLMNPISIAVDDSSNATLRINDLEVSSSISSIQSKIEILNSSVQASETITHEAPFTGSLSEYMIGCPVYATGVVKSFDFTANAWVNSTNSTNCISEVKPQGSPSEYVGILVAYVDVDGNHLRNLNAEKHNIRALLFASHGDFHVHVPLSESNSSTSYKAGDTLLLDGSVLSPSTPLTAKIKQSIIGTVTSVIDSNTIAMFRS